jgi:hypothetical protein
MLVCQMLNLLSQQHQVTIDLSPFATPRWEAPVVNSPFGSDDLPDPPEPRWLTIPAVAAAGGGSSVQAPPLPPAMTRRPRYDYAIYAAHQSRRRSTGVPVPAPPVPPPAAVTPRHYQQHSAAVYAAHASRSRSTMMPV